MRQKLLIGLIAISISILQYGCNQSSAKRLSETAVNVEVHQISSFDCNEEIAYSGTIQESESTPLSFSSVGTVARVLVSDGDFVKKGQLLAILNDETYKNANNMSLATLNQAEDAYKRLEPMYKNGNLPEIKFVEVETALQQARAGAAISKKNLDDCKLYSPVSGVVGKRSIEPGMMTMPNLSSINIVNIDKVFAVIPVSENEIASVKKGDIAKIRIAALNNNEFNGIVEEIGVIADPIAHTYKVKIGIANKEMQIKPGMICNAVLNKSNHNPGLSIPGHAVMVDENGKSFVYSVKNSIAEKKFVKTGKLLKNSVEIVEGLNSGEQIVTAGQQKLVDNSSVNIVNQ